MPFARLAILIAFLSAPFAHADSFALRWNTFGASDNEAAALRSFASTMEGRLPRKLKAGISSPIEIEFGAPSDFKTPDWGSCDSPSLRSENLARMANPSDWLGERVRFRKIVVNPAFRQAISAGPEKTQSSCRHGTTYHLALSAVLHQLARAYDLRADQDRELQQKLAEACAPSPSRDSADTGKSPECLRLGKIKHRVSDRQSFLSLTHFFETPAGYRSGYRDLDPKKIQESEPRLLSNPAEAFAAAFEHFLLNPAFSCEHPGIWAYLARHFEARPAGISCAGSLTAPLLGGPAETVTLDSSRVYRIEYLYALPGENDLTEAFGHAMLRVLSCSPRRGSPDASCIDDESSHYVLTAYPQNDGKSTIASLVGKDTAKLYVFSYPAIINGYVKKENRAIERVPLKLSPADIAVLIGTAYEWNKNYQGRWFDLTNNCVTHILDLLQAAVTELDFADLHAITPGQFKQALLKNRTLSDGSVERIPR